jgi:hypothetical protein
MTRYAGAVMLLGCLAIGARAARSDAQVRVPAIPIPGRPAPDGEAQVERRQPTYQVNIPPPVVDPCAIDPWLAKQSDEVGKAVVTLLRLQNIDPAGYTKSAPTDCAPKLLEYRVTVLSKIVAVMEAK